MKRHKFYMTMICMCIYNLLIAQSIPGDSLVFGPMFSPVYNDTVRVWVLTKDGTGSSPNLSIELKLSSGDTPLIGVPHDIDNRLGYHLRSFVYTNLLPGQSYTATILSNGQTTNKYTTIINGQNQVSDFEFLSGGCARIYDPIRCVDQNEMQTHINGTTDIFNQMANENSDLMLWLGDATYLLGIEHSGGNCPGMINDWDNEDELFKRYFFYRTYHDSLLRSMPQIAITDNHDTGGNEFYMTMPTLPISRKTFMQWWQNPNYLSTSQGQGLHSGYRYKDVEFFMLDNRSYRTATTQQLGNEQLEWLKQSLLNSTAPFKVLISGTPLVDETFMRAFSKTNQADSLFSFIKANNINGVMCYSADWHYNELFGDYTKHTYPFFDILNGKLNSDIGANPDTTIYFTPDYSKIFGYNGQIYTKTNVYGEVGDRRYQISYLSPQGLVKHSSIIHEDMLKSIDNDTRKLNLSFSNSLYDSTQYNHLLQSMNIDYLEDRNSEPLSALQFNNTSSITIPHSNELDMHDRTFSITYWMKPSIYPTDFSAIFSNGSIGNGYSIGIDSLGHSVFFNHYTESIYKSNYTNNIDEWTHTVWKYDNVKLQLFLYSNGVLMQQWSNVQCSVYSSSPLMLGNNFQSKHFNGMLDEFNLFGKLIGDQTIFLLSDYISNRGTALDLSGSQNLNIPNTQIDAVLSDGFTIETWARLKTNSPSGKILSSHANISGATSGISLELTPSNQVKVAIGTNTSWNSISTTIIPTVYEWNHYSITAIPNDSVYLYINGIKVGSTSFTNYYANTYGFYLGKSLYYGNPILGEMDELRIWSAPQSIEDIRKRMHYELEGSESDLKFYYNFSYFGDSTSIHSEGSNSYDIPLTNSLLIQSTAPVANITIDFRNQVEGNWSIEMNENSGLSLDTLIIPFTSNVVIGKLNDPSTLPIETGSDTYFLKGGWQLVPQNIAVSTLLLNPYISFPQFDSINAIASEYYLLKKNSQDSLVIVNNGNFEDQQLIFENTTLENGFYYLGWKNNASGLININNIKISVFPNPTNDYFVLKGVNSSDMEKIYVQDLSGDNVSLIMSDVGEDIRVEAITLSSGVYLLSFKLRERQNVSTVKIIKN